MYAQPFKCSHGGVCSFLLEKDKQVLSLESEVLKLRAENKRLGEWGKSLEGQLKREHRKASEAPFGLSTPSSMIPYKANSLEENQAKVGGAQVGHRGRGRQRPSSEQISSYRQTDKLEACPCCQGKLICKGSRHRVIRKLVPARIENEDYTVYEYYCPHCKKTHTTRIEGVFPYNTLNNSLLAEVGIEHYIYGTPLGRIEERMECGHGTLIGALHRMADLFEGIPQQLLQQYLQCPVKHADETHWRNDGRNGYSWLFTGGETTLFRFRQSRGAKVAMEVFGKNELPGVLVVDRYAGYNHVPCAIQYCYAHLLRDVKGLGKDFPKDKEVKRFVRSLSHYLSEAMRLRGRKLSLSAFLKKAAKTKERIIQITNAPAQHFGIQKIQNIFRENPHKLYHWAIDPAIPAENNRAERELRPLVIARKISFGSQSEKGLRTREILMTVLHTLAARTDNLFNKLTSCLNQLSSNPKLDPFQVLFSSS